MQRVTRHLRVGMVLVLLVILASVPLAAGAATALPLVQTAVPKVIITELQTSGSTSSEEFVEFYNTTDTDIDFADTAHAGKEPWKLQFFGASKITNGTTDWSSPSSTVLLKNTIPAHGYYVLASTGYAPSGVESNGSYYRQMTDEGGAVQLVSATTTQVTYYDRLVWKQQTAVASLPAGVLATPTAKGSLQRVPNDDSEYVNSDGTLADFTLAADITPADMWRQPLPPEIPDAKPDPTSSPNAPGTTDPGESTLLPVPEVTPNNAGLSAPSITELMPNPAAPLTDEKDEFVELYNPNSTAFNLKGYTVETGTTSAHRFTFSSDFLLQPMSYTALYSIDTRLSLSNAAGQARLLDPSGATLSESSPYAAPASGYSWSLTDGTWQWTTTSTPNAANVITAPLVPVKTAAPTTATTDKAAAAKAASKTTAAKTASKVKGTTSAKSNATKAKTSKAKAAAKSKTAKKSKKKTALTNTAQTSAAPQRAPIHTAVLVTVVAIAVLYAAYEYRHDISNRLYKLRHNRAVSAYARQ